MIPPESLQRLSNSCRTELAALQCQRDAPGKNDSALICSLIAGASDGTSFQTPYLAIAVTASTLAVILNVFVVITLSKNRRLHTVANFLISLMCGNNMLWSMLTFSTVPQLNTYRPQLCSLRIFLVHSCRQTYLVLIVAITFARYLIIVRGYSYPPNKTNISVCTAIVVTLSVAFSVPGYWINWGLCKKAFAWTPQRYAITLLGKCTGANVSIWVLGAEIVFGMGVLIFSYTSILCKVVRSRRGLRGYGDPVPHCGAHSTMRGVSCNTAHIGTFSLEDGNRRAPCARERTGFSSNRRSSRHIGVLPRGETTCASTPEPFVIYDRQRNFEWSSDRVLADDKCEIYSSELGTAQSPRANRVSIQRGARSDVSAVTFSDGCLGSKDDNSSEEANLQGQQDHAEHTSREKVPSGLTSSSNARNAGVRPLKTQSSHGFSETQVESRPPEVKGDNIGATNHGGSKVSTFAASLSGGSNTPKPVSILKRKRTTISTLPSLAARSPRPVPAPGASSALHSAATSSTAAPARAPADKRRVDIVTGICLAVLLLAFLSSFLPDITLMVIHYNRRDCLVFPGRRMKAAIMLLLTGGATAISSPIIYVVFSRDFRQAFLDTVSGCRRCYR